MKQDNAAISEILSSNEQDILQEWLAELTSGGTRRSDGGVASLTDARELLQTLRDGISAGGDARQFDSAQEWAPARATLGSLSATRAAKGASAGETSQFVLSL